MKPQISVSAQLLSPKLSTGSASEKIDALVLLVHSSSGTSPSLDGGPTFRALDEKLQGELSKHLGRARFAGERNSVRVVPTLGGLPCAEVILVGMGPRPGTPVGLSESVALGVRASLANRPLRVLVDIDDSEPSGESLLGLDRIGQAALGAVLGSYQFDRYFGEKQKANVTLQKLGIVADKSAQKSLDQGALVASGVCLARDLVNEPPNELYPESFAARAKSVAKAEQLDCKVLDEKGLALAGMNLHLAVGQGSVRKPRFVHLTYRPSAPKGRLVFVGKGITFDSGGICIKPMQGMADMKSDMAGAAAVLGMMSVVRKMALPVEVHGLLGLAENMPDGNAYRPADVIVALNGKGVEIINTDAEGRLVLADALTYGARLDPDFMVDAATLTGATLISLGPSYSAFFTGHEELGAAMTDSAKIAGENFWRMPLVEELAQELKSDVTDLQHTGQRYGGAISAALFLREFVEGKPWIHADIPGATYRDRASGLHPKGGTGHGVLTFLELIHRHAQTPVVREKEKAAKTSPGKAKMPRKGSKKVSAKKTTQSR